MREYVITTDTTADLAEEYIEKQGLRVMSLTYMIDGESYNRSKELPYKEFYEKMRSGSMPTTSQVNPEEAKEIFQSILESGKDVLHIAFSSGLSGSYNSARVAAEELAEEMPEGKVIVVDSLCVSLGEGLLVHKALQRKAQGMECEELAAWVEEKKMNMVHAITVEDLFHLYRGGRVSKAAAVVGTMIHLKPVLHIDRTGHLIPVAKVRGRKKSLLALVDSMEKNMGSFRDENNVVSISHGDCMEDAEFVKNLVEERFGIKEFLINPIGPTIGAHSGPGTVGLFYMGNVR